MAPRKSNPMEQPPAASSDDGEESSSDELTSSDDDHVTLSSPKPSHSVASAPQKKSLSSEEDSGSESESESESDPDSTPKPVATKPMEETPKASTTKPRSKAPAKRPNETEETPKDSKRTKKNETDADPVDEDQKKPGEDTKKQLFQRLWSEEDEIAVLKGMIDFTTKKGVDPNQDMNAFHDFIKKSLHVDVTRSQVMDKIRRLKKKYENNLGREKKGEDRTFSKLHERQAYELSKKLWGSEDTSGVLESAAKSNGKARKNQTQRGNSKSLPILKAELNDGGKEGEKMEIDNDKEGNLSNAKVKLLFNESVGMAGLEEFVINQGLDMIGGAKKEELEERWKQLQIAQLQLFVERNDLIKEQTKLMLEAMKSSG
ncbi:probable transcription factor At1g11510 [Mangifera indica]|uniref:probable transcription factor At1g11510 n=1 Tax=Mangifera indica TaxID=29780 RepID=UPI001CFAA80A|nr:probable transcription factor At1g11510 [Mangifera indica]